MSKNSTPDVDFSFVRYANCWEDPNLLIKGMNLSSGDAVLSIASAGDNSLSLLTTGAEVVAVDLNATQIACVELRKVAVKALEYSDFLAFIGVNHSNCRIETYRTFSDNLSKESKFYWDNNLEAIESGIIFSGKFENYFKLFRTKIMPWIHRRSTIEKLFYEKSLEERELFYNKKWNNWRWRLLF